MRRTVLKRPVGQGLEAVETYLVERFGESMLLAYRRNCGRAVHNATADEAYAHICKHPKCDRCDAAFRAYEPNFKLVREVVIRENAPKPVAEPLSASATTAAPTTKDSDTVPLIHSNSIISAAGWEPEPRVRGRRRMD